MVGCRQLEIRSFIIEIGDTTTSTVQGITTWVRFFKGLHKGFYLPGFNQELLTPWLHPRKLPNKTIQAYIDILCKLHLQLHVSEREEVLIIKLNSSLLFFFLLEVDLFESASLDKAFLKALKLDQEANYLP